MSTHQGFNTLQHRMADYYLNKMRAAETAYQYGHSGQALKLFDQEWPQIEQSHAWVIANYADAHEISRLCIEYSLFNPEMLELRQVPRKRIAWLQIGLDASKLLNDIHSVTKHFYLIAAAYNDCGEFSLAEDYALQAVVQAQSNKDLFHLALSFSLLGNVYRVRGDLVTAENYFQQSLKIFRELENTRQTGQTLGGLGLVAWRNGDWKNARNLLSESLHIAREFANEIDICNALINLSLPNFVLGDLPLSRTLVNECITRSRAISYYRVQASSINTLGQFEKAENNLWKALEHFEEAISICRKTGVNWALDDYLHNAGITLFQLHEYTQALKYTQEALAISRSSNKHLSIGETLCTQIQIYKELGNLALSLQSLREAIQIANEVNNPVLKLHILMSAMMVWHYLGKHEEAAEWAGLLLSLPSCAPEEYDQIQQSCVKLRAKLGSPAFNAALERGKTLDIEVTLQGILRKLGEHGSTTKSDTHTISHGAVLPQ